MVYSSLFGPAKGLYYGNIAEFVYTSPHVKANPNKRLLIDPTTDESLTVRQVLEISGKIHSVLETFGYKSQDAICLFAPNSIYTSSIHFGILGLGAVVSPANVAYTAEELAHQLRLSGSKALITVEALLETSRKAAALVDTSIRVITIKDLLAIVAKTTNARLPIKLSKEEAVTKHAYYCFSSGTSGLPKCVILTHHNIIANVQQDMQAGPEVFTSNNVYGGVLPFSHIFALSFLVVLAPYQAASVVVFSAFNFEQVLQSVIKYGITTMFIVPPMAVLFAKSPLVEKYNDIKKTLSLMICGAAPLGGATAQEAERRTGALIQQGYGMTEMSPVSHMFTYDIKNCDNASIGWLLPGTHAKVVAEDGTEAKQGEPGEIYIQGPQVMLGYKDNAKANAETFADGWLRTGDIAVVDKSEQFYIVDRAKELIKSKGHQVAPAELEALLFQHKNVADCAVIGIWSEDENTELPRAFLVLNDKTRNPLEVKQWLDDRVSRHKKLWGGVVVIDEIPKSPSGKILRRFLRNRKDDKVIGLKPTNSARL